MVARDIHATLPDARGIGESESHRELCYNDRVNYFTHALPFLDGDPYFIAGTAVPDWMAVADRPVRVRAKLAQPVAESHSDPRVTAAARGVLQHLHDDDWFHATRGFAEVTSELTRMFRQSLGPEHPTNCAFLGHIVTELLLDWTLIERHPGYLAQYYDLLRKVDAAVVQDTVNQIARGTTERLAGLIPLFLEERFLEDYADDARLLWRLNMVMRRVKQPEMPESLTEVLAAARNLVALRVGDLLPPESYSVQIANKL